MINDKLPAHFSLLHSVMPFMLLLQSPLLEHSETGIQKEFKSQNYDTLMKIYYPQNW